MRLVIDMTSLVICDTLTLDYHLCNVGQQQKDSPLMA